MNFIKVSAFVEGQRYGNTVKREKNVAQCHFVNQRPKWTKRLSTESFHFERPETTFFSLGPNPYGDFVKTLSSPRLYTMDD